MESGLLRMTAYSPPIKSPTGYGGDEVHFAVFSDLFQHSNGCDFPVNRNGYAGSYAVVFHQARLHTWVDTLQVLYDLAYRGAWDLDLAMA